MRTELVDQFVTLLLRMPVGLVFLFAGINKLRDLTKFAEGMRKQFAETFLSGPLLEAFLFVLPWAELAVGALVVVGLFTRPALVATGLLLVVLIFGLAVAGRYETVAQNTLYVLVIAFALRTAESNMFSLDYFVARRWGER
jgi:thiosulfate dehydrogenase [quinone] large subunit